MRGCLEDSKSKYGSFGIDDSILQSSFSSSLSSKYDSSENNYGVSGKDMSFPWDTEYVADRIYGYHTEYFST